LYWFLSINWCVPLFLKLLYKTSSPANNVQDGWTRSELVFVIPDDYPEETINFYMWNPTPDSVWVDDFSISVFP